MVSAFAQEPQWNGLRLDLDEHGGTTTNTKRPALRFQIRNTAMVVKTISGQEQTRGRLSLSRFRLAQGNHSVLPCASGRPVDWSLDDYCHNKETYTNNTCVTHTHQARQFRSEQSNPTLCSHFQTFFRFYPGNLRTNVTQNCFGFGFRRRSSMICSALRTSQRCDLIC
jgi:hypothetical protein